LDFPGRAAILSLQRRQGGSVSRLCTPKTVTEILDDRYHLVAASVSACRLDPDQS